MTDGPSWTWPSTRLDETDLAIIEATAPSAVVTRLIVEIRRLQDEAAGSAVRITELEHEVARLEAEADEREEEE